MEISRKECLQVEVEHPFVGNFWFSVNCNFYVKLLENFLIFFFFCLHIMRFLYSNMDYSAYELINLFSFFV